MDHVDVAQLEDFGQHITASIKSLVDAYPGTDAAGSLAPNPDEDNDPQKLTANILANMASIRSLLAGPTEFLQHLSSQVCSLLFRVTSTEDPFLSPPRQDSPGPTDGGCHAY